MSFIRCKKIFLVYICKKTQIELYETDFILCFNSNRFICM